MTDIHIAIIAALLSAFAGIAGVILQVIYSRKSEKFKKYYDYQLVRFKELKEFKEKLQELDKITFGENVELLKLSDDKFKMKFATETITKFYKTDELFEDYQFYFDVINIKNLLEKRNKLNKMHSEIKSLILEYEVNKKNIENDSFTKKYKYAISESVNFCSLMTEYTNKELSRITEYIRENAV